MRRSVRTGDGVDLEIVEFGGTGDPVLLLHGLMGRATTWWRHAVPLTGSGRVLSYDARGHGRSAARGPWTTERMAADAADVLAPLGPGVVIGHSMGGLHGLALAAARPDLVRALVVEDMGVDFRGRSAADARAWFGALPPVFTSLAHVRSVLSGPRPEIGEYLAECVGEGPDGYRLLASLEHTHAIAAEWAERDFRPLLAHVRCPVLLIEAGEPIAPGQMAEMADLLPDARHVRIAGTGHLVHDAAPDAWLAAVRAFLS